MTKQQRKRSIPKIMTPGQRRQADKRLQQITRAIEVDNFRRALHAHDWHYEYSDDHNAYLAGEIADRRLREEAERLHLRHEYDHAKKSAK